MTRLADLIEELCPDGVEYKPLGEVAELKRGQSITKKSITPGDIPVIAGGRKPAYFTSSANRTGMTIVVAGSGAYAGFVSYWDQPIFVSDAFSVKVNEKILVPRFTYHWVCGKQKELYSLKSGGGVPHVYPKDVAKFKCPIPPLEVQCEIVRILDQFTTLEVELEVELEARRVQYEYYRNQLLSYDALASRGPVEWLKLGEVGEFVRGSGLQKSDFVDEGLPCIHYGQIHTRFGIAADEAVANISVMQFHRLKHANHGDLLIATTSEDDEAVGKATVWLGQEEVAIGGDMFIFRHVLEPKYVSYFFASSLFGDQKRPYITGTKVRRISEKGLSRIRIPVPSIEEQRRIADVLDRFDALVNDISSGLPAEIAARRTQYEYYRDRLLSFPEKK